MYNDEEILQSHVLTKALKLQGKEVGCLTVPPLLHIRNKPNLLKMIKCIHRDVPYGPEVAKLSLNLVEFNNGILYAVKWTDADKLASQGVNEIHGSSFPELTTVDKFNKSKAKEYSLVLSTNPDICDFLSWLEIDGPKLEAQPDLIYGALRIKTNMSEKDMVMSIAGVSLFFLRSLGGWDCKAESGVMRHVDLKAWLDKA